MMSAQVPSRRDMLRLGAAGVMGWSLPQCLALAAAGKNNPKATAKNVLVVLEQGGLSHMDTWDPKPEAIAEHRSPHKPISTNVVGMRFTDLLTETSKVADKLAVVRSMWHQKPGASGHPDGTQYALSGSHPSSTIPMPDIGSVVSQILGTACPYLPPYIMVPGNHEQAAVTSTGFLPAGTKVFKTGGSNLADPKWKVGGLEPRPETPADRLAAREQLLSGMNAHFSQGSGSTAFGGMDRFYEQAFDTLTSPKVAKAFDYQGEPLSVRERYGIGHRGACYLVGRKLIEAGVRFVTVDTRWPLMPDLPGGFNLNWDHHDAIYSKGSCGTIRDKAGGEGRYGIGHWVMMGSTDRAFAALIADMDQRGLLAETLVCFVTEFGRTPKLNKFGGRDHWTGAYSIAFAGAGVRGGQIIGSSDKDGGHVTNDPYTPEAYAATIYEKLGIDRSKPLYMANNRPIFIGHDADPIPQVL
ncbi:MAG: DUF1501 domain-containing protein [Planctomycetes bacterium]|nr:DUF1501 domain-containing protein [Planctomycetota bacterium]